MLYAFLTAAALAGIMLVVIGVILGLCAIGFILVDRLHAGLGPFGAIGAAVLVMFGMFFVMALFK